MTNPPETIAPSIEIPTTPDMVQNRERLITGDHLPCIICGRPVKATNPWMVHIFYGSIIVTEAEAARIIASEGDGGDLYFYPVGSKCLQNHPHVKPYARRSMDLFGPEDMIKDPSLDSPAGIPDYELADHERPIVITPDY